MSDIFTGVLSGAASAYAAYLNYQSQKETNALSVDLANTAVQRRAKDMAAAGINPLMAAGQPAAVPGLKAPEVGNPVADAVAGAQGGANIAVTEAQARKTGAEARSAIADADLKETLLGQAKQTGLSNLASSEIKNAAEAAMAQSDADFKDSMNSLRYQALQAGVSQAEYDVVIARIRGQLEGKTLEWFDNQMRLGNLSTIAGVLGTAVGSAAKAAVMF